jgi:tetratricopeptide (TPR) repeat protein
MIGWARRTLDLDPRHLLAREYIAGAYWKLGDFDRQMEESLQHAEVFGAPAAMLEELRQAYARGGRRAVVEWTLSRASGADPNPVQMALLHGEIGRLDEAFRHLDAAIDRRDPILVHLAVAPQWDSLRGDPRWPERLARMGLPAL